MFKRHYTPQYTTCTSFSSDVTGNVVVIDWETAQKFLKKLKKLRELHGAPNPTDRTDLDPILNNLDNYDIKSIKPEGKF